MKSTSESLYCFPYPMIIINNQGGGDNLIFRNNYDIISLQLLVAVVPFTRNVENRDYIIINNVVDNAVLSRQTTGVGNPISPFKGS